MVNILNQIKGNLKYMHVEYDSRGNELSNLNNFHIDYWNRNIVLPSLYSHATRTTDSLASIDSFYYSQPKKFEF